jgi:HEAT repeat protein
MTCEELDTRVRAWNVFREKIDWPAGVEPCIARALDANRAAGDWLTFEKYVILAIGQPSPSYTETLCAVLDERREDINSEDIVDALGDIRDPAAIPSLARAISWVADSDEFGQLPRKAVWSLGRIGTPEALAAIRDNVTPDLPEKVTEAAEQVLGNH